MNGTNEIIAGTAFEIVTRSFDKGEAGERHSFRLKNLTRSEALEFLRVWQSRSAEHGLERVQILVASDSHVDFPQEFRADPQHSITYYRNNNEHGLVYIETKVESDEQGLKNLFTLRDVNFLDGTFDEEGDFSVPEEMVRQALKSAGASNADGHELMRDRLVEVLHELIGSGMTIPVRKYAKFLYAAAAEVVSGSNVYSPDETNALVGRCLAFLDMFPDENWRQDTSRLGRRLFLNLLRSELAASPSADLIPEKVAQDCLNTKFVNEQGERYPSDAEEEWRKACYEYCFDPSRERRDCIPYRIFDQVFSKDVKGLPLGQRVANEISTKALPRKADFDDLGVEHGLNIRSTDDARKLLESNPDDPVLLPLKDLLSKQTLRMVEKLAAPSVETVRNPLIKLSQVASAFRGRNELDEGEFRIELRVGQEVSIASTSTLGLFAFLYGSSLREISKSLEDGVGTIVLLVDENLMNQVPPPVLKSEADTESDTVDSTILDEEEGTVWQPVPLEFILVDASNGNEIDSETAIEWYPEELSYLALFWISVCGEDRASLEAEVIAPRNRSGEAWISEVSQRLLPFQTGSGRPIPKDVLSQPIISRLIEVRAEFRQQAGDQGLSSSMLNDVFDGWVALLADARTAFVPDGDVPLGMIEFLNADCVLDFDDDCVLMLQSHPIKLRWISEYLSKSSELAADAIEGTLNLNSQNEGMYLNWIQNLSPHQQPSIHVATEGHILFAVGERGWTEKFQRKVSSGGSASGGRIHSSLVAEISRQITAYLHTHPYKSDGLRILVVTGGASALPADIVQSVRKGEFRNLDMTIELVAPKACWPDAARQFELVDTENRLTGDGQLFPPVQLNLHELELMKDDADAALGDLMCDLAIVPQFLDDNITIDTKTEDETTSIGKFKPLLDDSTYVASGAGSSALWVSLRPKMPDTALSSWSTLAVRYEKKTPVAADRPEATDFIDIRINFNNAARFFGALHNRSQWVITVERHITREQIEKLESRPEVLSLRDNVGPGGLFTLIVSSNAGKQFVIDRLTRKLKRIAASIGRAELVEQQAHQLAKKIYDEARQIAPRLTLDALGISRVTEEILGLSVARCIADNQASVSVVDGFIAWISLDEHPEWFLTANAMRADMIRLAVNQTEAGLSIDLLVMESKLRRTGYDGHGAEQVRKTLQMFDAVFPQNKDLDAVDGELWRDTILSAVDTVSDDAVFIAREVEASQKPRRSRIPEEIRSRFREGEFVSVKLAGLFSICEYSHSREITVEEYDSDPRVKIVQTGGSALLDRPTFPSVFASHKMQDSVDASNQSGQNLPVPEQLDGEEESLVETSIPPVRPARDGTDISVDTNEPSAGLSDTDAARGRLGKVELDRRYQVILDTFGQYGISVNKADPSVDHAVEGPASILFRVRPGKGVDPKKLSDKRDALKLSMELEASQDMRFAIDKGYVTIDVPKLDKDRYFVDASDLWTRWKRPEFGLTVPLGEDRFGNVVQIDFTSSNSPHLLIGGTTGSGKSEALNTILAGFTEHYSPEEVRLQLIDPKGTELEHLAASDHLDGEIGWDEDDAIEILGRAVDEMQSRYVRFKAAKVRSLVDYNALESNPKYIPRWVIVLDEYADLTSDTDAKKIIEGHLKRLAQKARAAGIHVIIATQKPDASVISTNLRSNLPAQLALRVKSATESRVIMDDGGAESLTGKGDAFFKESGVLTRVQCAKT
ncbi:MAG: FtsK/SpoIIIE domain-containing protein [Roseobacter sp.]